MICWSKESSDQGIKTFHSNYHSQTKSNWNHVAWIFSLTTAGQIWCMSCVGRNIRNHLPLCCSVTTHCFLSMSVISWWRNQFFVSSLISCPCFSLSTTEHQYHGVTSKAFSTLSGFMSCCVISSFSIICSLNRNKGIVATIRKSITNKTLLTKLCYSKIKNV